MTDSADGPRETVNTRFDPIHEAARMRDVEGVREALASGVDVDCENGRAANGDGGNTALWFAAQGSAEGGLRVARVLVLAGAEINRRGEHGRTALHMAAAWGNLDVVKYLIDQGADATLRDEDGLTPAELARHSGRVAAEKLTAVASYFASNAR